MNGSILTCNHAPPPPHAYSRGFAVFFLVVYFPPPGTQKGTFLTPELLIDLIIRFVWVYLLESNSDFCTMQNERFLKFY